MTLGTPDKEGGNLAIQIPGEVFPRERCGRNYPGFHPASALPPGFAFCFECFLWVQVRSGILSESTHCPAEKAVLLASFGVQAKYGNYEKEVLKAA